MESNISTVTELELRNILSLWDEQSNRDYYIFLNELGLDRIIIQDDSIITYFPIVDKKKWLFSKLKYGI